MSPMNTEETIGVGSDGLDGPTNGGEMANTNLTTILPATSNNSNSSADNLNNNNNTHNNNNNNSNNIHSPNNNNNNNNNLHNTVSAAADSSDNQPGTPPQQQPQQQQQQQQQQSVPMDVQPQQHQVKQQQQFSTSAQQQQQQVQDVKMAMPYSAYSPYSGGGGGVGGAINGINGSDSSATTNNFYPLLYGGGGTPDINTSLYAQQQPPPHHMQQPQPPDGPSIASHAFRATYTDEPMYPPYGLDHGNPPGSLMQQRYRAYGAAGLCAPVDAGGGAGGGGGNSVAGTENGNNIVSSATMGSPRVGSSTSPTSTSAANNNNNNNNGSNTSNNNNNSLHLNGECNLQCMKCGVLYANEADLQEHINNVHRNSPPYGSVAGGGYANSPYIREHEQHNGGSIGGGVTTAHPGEILDLDSQRLIYPSMLQQQHQQQLPPHLMQQHQQQHHEPSNMFDMRLNPLHSMHNMQQRPLCAGWGGQTYQQQHPQHAQQQQNSLDNYADTTVAQQQQLQQQAPPSQAPPSQAPPTQSLMPGSPAEFPSTTTGPPEPPPPPPPSAAAASVPSQQQQSYLFEGPSSSSSAVSTALSVSVPSTSRAASWKSNEARRPKTYHCTACNKWFTSSGHLKRHYNTALHKTAVKTSGQPDPATQPIATYHHPARDPNARPRTSRNSSRAQQQQQQQQQASVPVQTPAIAPPRTPPDYNNTQGSTTAAATGVGGLVGAAGIYNGSSSSPTPPTTTTPTGLTHGVYGQQNGYASQHQIYNNSNNMSNNISPAQQQQHTVLTNGHPNGLAGPSVTVNSNNNNTIATQILTTTTRATTTPTPTTMLSSSSQTRGLLNTMPMSIMAKSIIIKEEQLEMEMEQLEDPGHHPQHLTPMVMDMGMAIDMHDTVERTTMVMQQQQQHHHQQQQLHQQTHELIVDLVEDHREHQQPEVVRLQSFHQLQAQVQAAANNNNNNSNNNMLITSAPVLVLEPVQSARDSNNIILTADNTIQAATTAAPALPHYNTQLDIISMPLLPRNNNMPPLPSLLPTITSSTTITNTMDTMVGMPPLPLQPQQQLLLPSTAPEAEREQVEAVNYHQDPHRQHHHHQPVLSANPPQQPRIINWLAQTEDLMSTSNNMPLLNSINSMLPPQLSPLDITHNIIQPLPQLPNIIMPPQQQPPLQQLLPQSIIPLSQQLQLAADIQPLQPTMSYRTTTGNSNMSDDVNNNRNGNNNENNGNANALMDIEMSAIEYTELKPAPIKSTSNIAEQLHLQTLIAIDSNNIMNGHVITTERDNNVVNTIIDTTIFDPENFAMDNSLPPIKQEPAEDGRIRSPLYCDDSGISSNLNSPERVTSPHFMPGQTAVELQTQITVVPLDEYPSTSTGIISQPALKQESDSSDPGPSIRIFKRRRNGEHINNGNVVRPEKCDLPYGTSMWVYKGITIQINREESGIITCLLCNKSFKGVCYLKQHTESVHSTDMTHRCDVCGKRFKTEERFKEHRPRHDPGDKPEKCVHCTKQFQHKPDLVRHIDSIHLDMKRFLCHICEKRFSRQDHLLKHIETHTRQTNRGASNKGRRKSSTSTSSTSSSSSLSSSPSTSSSSMHDATAYVQQPNVQQPNVQQPNVQLLNVQQPNLQLLNVQQPNVQLLNVQQPNVQQPNIELGQLINLVIVKKEEE